MLNQPMLEKLLALRLHGMVDALKAQEPDRTVNELSFLERLALLVDQQWSWRENQALARRLKAAKLRGTACVEDIDYRAVRGLEKTVVRALAKDSAWVRNHENIFVIGPCGVGKSFLASALAQKACRDGYSALYLRAAALSRELALARADGSLRHFLARLSRIDVLVIDDWAMAPLSEAERREVWEICEDRYQTRSTILTSQLPVSRWHEQIGDPTIADGILDRLVHNAHRIEMRGESMRKKNNLPDEKKRRSNELFFYIEKQGIKGLAAPFPCTPNPRLSSFASLRIRSGHFQLTKPNTSCTIITPASLRSDCCSPSLRNAVRLPSGISVHLRRNTHLPRITEQRGQIAGQMMVLVEGAQRQQTGVAGDLPAGKIGANGLMTVEGEGQLW